MRSCEICVLKRDEQCDWEKFEVMPSICLLVQKEPIDSVALERMVKGSISIGAIWFMTYGESADYLEEQIDCVLEDGDTSWSNIPTTSHGDETVDDVAHFFVNSAYRGDAKFRCLMILDSCITGAPALEEEARRQCSLV